MNVRKNEFLFSVFVAADEVFSSALNNSLTKSALASQLSMAILRDSRRRVRMYTRSICMR